MHLFPKGCLLCHLPLGDPDPPTVQDSQCDSLTHAEASVMPYRDSDWYLWYGDAA